MADSRNLANAVEMANLYLSPSEEQLIWLYLNQMDRQIEKILSEKEEIRSPYEFN